MSEAGSDERIAAFSLREFVAQNGAVATTLPDGSMRIETCAVQWGYSLVFPVRSGALARLRGDRSVLVRVTLTAHRGIVGIAFLNRRTGKFCTREVFAATGDQNTQFELFSENADDSLALVLRNAAPGNTPSTAILGGIATFSARALTTGERRQRQARNFPYWHYEHDLGYGAKTEPKRPEITKWHTLRQRIIFGLLEERYERSLAGTHCIDYACCSGFWSFCLADRGASRVVALDKNAQHIEQARFVQACSDDPRHKGIEFLHADILSYEVEPRGFDIVLCLGLMYHLTDPVGAAARVFQATRGLAIIDSSVSSLSGTLLEFADWRKYSGCFENEFAFVPTRDALIRIFEHAGFSNVSPWSPLDRESEAAYGMGKSRVLLIAER